MINPRKPLTRITHIMPLCVRWPLVPARRARALGPRGDRSQFQGHPRDVLRRSNLAIDICVPHTYVTPMMMIVELKMKIVSWNEVPYRESPDAGKFAKADVLLAADGGNATGAFESLLYYRPDGTGSYVCVLQLTDAIEGRAGSFVLQGTGTYDGTTAQLVTTVVAGSGTGDLVGLTGTATSTSTHEDYPYMPITLQFEAV